MKTPIIEIKNLSKCYKNAIDHSLNDVTLTINAGDKIGIFGPNGAGKTTLISIISKVIRASSGEIIYHPSIEKELRIGLVPQDLALYEDLTAYQNLEYFGALCKLSKSTIKSRAKELLTILGLKKVEHTKVKTFSGGMKRRLNLAIGIIHEPEVIFLDEPTVGVDIQSKNAIMAFLDELNKKGATIVYTSHHMSEAEEFCNNIAILDHGKLIANANIQNLLNQHQAQSLMEVLINLTGKEYRDNV